MATIDTVRELRPHDVVVLPPRSPRGRPAWRHTSRRGWWLRLNVVALVLSLVPTTLRVLGSLGSNDSWAYAATEWLINNQGGTTRRGLAGDLLLAVPVVSDGTALVITVLALALAVSGGFAALVARVIRTTDSPWPLVFWLLPGGLILGTLQANVHGMTIAATDFSMRKEYLFLAILLAVVLASLRWSSRRAWPWIALPASLVLAAGVFVHEGLAVVVGACTVYYLLRLHPNPPAPMMTLPGPAVTRRYPVPTAMVLAAPAMVGLGIVSAITAYGGADRRATWRSVDVITRDWLPSDTVSMWGVDTGLPSAVWWLGSDTSGGVQAVATGYLHSGAWRAWAIMAVTMVVWVGAAGWLVNRNPRGLARNLATVAGIAALLVPLAVVAIDWGRWLVLLGLLASILFLSRPVSPDYPPAPAPITSRTKALVVGLVLIALAMVIPVAGTDFPLAGLLT